MHKQSHGENKHANVNIISQKSNTCGKNLYVLCLSRYRNQT